MDQILPEDGKRAGVPCKGHAPQMMYQHNVLLLLIERIRAGLDPINENSVGLKMSQTSNQLQVAQDSLCYSELQETKDQLRLTKDRVIAN